MATHRGIQSTCQAVVSCCVASGCSSSLSSGREDPRGRHDPRVGYWGRPTPSDAAGPVPRRRAAATSAHRPLPMSAPAPDKVPPSSRRRNQS